MNHILFLPRSSLQFGGCGNRGSKSVLARHAPSPQDTITDHVPICSQPQNSLIEVSTEHGVLPIFLTLCGYISCYAWVEIFWKHMDMWSGSDVLSAQLPLVLMHSVSEWLHYHWGSWPVADSLRLSKFLQETKTMEARAQPQQSLHRYWGLLVPPQMPCGIMSPVNSACWASPALDLMCVTAAVSQMDKGWQGRH